MDALRHALSNPDRARRYLRRVRRDTLLRLRHPRDHVAYYRAVMRDTIVRGDATAVGDRATRRWHEIGQLQFDYLRSHDLQPHHRLLEIGCGNLRAGWHFVRYLDAGHYYGIDISAEALMSAQGTIAHKGLAAKLPYLALVDNLRFEFLPDECFDVVHAHSVFSHSPLSVIEECFAHVGRILAPTGFFDFTFNRTSGGEHHVLREDFYYRTETLLDAARRHGLHAELMADWERLPHRQSKIRVQPGARVLDP
jgi:SAM-dependent methyltransferase